MLHARRLERFRFGIGQMRVAMKRETLRSLRELAYFSSLGLAVALSIFIGLAIGVYLDRHCLLYTSDAADEVSPV